MYDGIGRPLRRIGHGRGLSRKMREHRVQNPDLLAVDLRMGAVFAKGVVFLLRRRDIFPIQIDDDYEKRRPVLPARPARMAENIDLFRRLRGVVERKIRPYVQLKYDDAVHGKKDRIVRRPVEKSNGGGIIGGGEPPFETKIQPLSLNAPRQIPERHDRHKTAGNADGNQSVYESHGSDARKQRGAKSCQNAYNR